MIVSLPCPSPFTLVGDATAGAAWRTDAWKSLPRIEGMGTKNKEKFASVFFLFFHRGIVLIRLRTKNDNSANLARIANSQLGSFNKFD